MKQASWEHTPQVSAAMADAIVRLLQRFFELLAQRDFGAAAELWDPPALVLGDWQVHGAMSRAHLERWLCDAVLPSSTGPAAAPAAPVTARSCIRSAEWVAERVARLELSWPGGRALGPALEGVEGTSFLVRVDEFREPKIRGLVLLASGYPQPLQVS